jgi:hypothetical protein
VRLILLRIEDRNFVEDSIFMNDVLDRLDQAPETRRVQVCPAICRTLTLLKTCGFIGPTVDS